MKTFLLPPLSKHRLSFQRLVCSSIYWHVGRRFHVPILTSLLTILFLLMFILIGSPHEIVESDVINHREQNKILRYLLSAEVPMFLFVYKLIGLTAEVTLDLWTKMFLGARWSSSIFSNTYLMPMSSWIVENCDRILSNPLSDTTIIRLYFYFWRQVQVWRIFCRFNQLLQYQPIYIFKSIWRHWLFWNCDIMFWWCINLVLRWIYFFFVHIDDVQNLDLERIRKTPKLHMPSLCLCLSNHKIHVECHCSELSAVLVELQDFKLCIWI